MMPTTITITVIDIIKIGYDPPGVAALAQEELEVKVQRMDWETR
jgi:hypothetical protein